MSGATKINHGQSDCVINWAGGLHHAKKGEVKSCCQPFVSYGQYVSPVCSHALSLLGSKWQ